VTILVTGFEPFGDHVENPSQAVVEALAGAPGLVTAVLPVTYGAAGSVLIELIESHAPAAVICLGVAGGRSAISLERVALNLNDAKAPDNAGEIRSGSMIEPEGPLAYWSTLPLDAMHEALQTAKIPVDISNHAGAYLCNHVFFCARHHFMRRGEDRPTGFIHLPPTAHSPDDAGLPLVTMIEAIRLCLIVIDQHLVK
jgi:pyroglutamyl-peptidase